MAKLGILQKDMDSFEILVHLHANSFPKEQLVDRAWVYLLKPPETSSVQDLRLLARFFQYLDPLRRYQQLDNPLF
jgi:hypothetical protein